MDISETGTTVVTSHQGKFIFFSRVQYKKRIYANLKWVVDRNLLQIHLQLDLLLVWTSWISMMCKTRCWATLCSRSQLLNLHGRAWVSFFFPTSCHCFFMLAKDTMSSFYPWILRFGLSLTAFHPIIIKLFLCTISHGRQWQKAVTSKNLGFFFPWEDPLNTKCL